MNQPARRLNLYRYFPVAIFLGFAVLMTTCFMLVFASRSGAKVDRDSVPIQGLPENAEEISYYIPGLMGKDIYYDFKTSEAGFMKWLQSYDDVIELQRRSTGSGFVIERFNHEDREPEKVTVNTGLLYSWTEEGKGVFVGFDRDTGFAYFHSKSD